MPSAVQDGPSEGEAALRDPAALTDLFRSRREALVDAAIQVAKDYGYAQYTTTIRAAWTEAIHTVTEGLCGYLAGAGAAPERLGSSGTLKVVHARAATSGAATTAGHRQGPLLRRQAAVASPASAVTSSPNRRARFQPAIWGGFTTPLQSGPRPSS